MHNWFTQVWVNKCLQNIFYTSIKNTLIKDDIIDIFKEVNVVHLEQLSRNLAKVFDDREHDSIMTIVVNKQGYSAHKSILSSTSSYLRYIMLNFLRVQ